MSKKKGSGTFCAQAPSPSGTPSPLGTRGGPTGKRFLTPFSFLREGRELRRRAPFAAKVRAALRSLVIAGLYPFVRAVSALEEKRGRFPLRLVNLLSRLALRRGKRPLFSLRVVLYHHVFDDERESFRRHMAWLAGRYEFVGIERFLALLAGREKCDRPALLVTFDDGFKDNVTNALPILEEFAVKAAFFASTDFVSLDGTDAGKYRHYAREVFHTPGAVENMSWADLAELARRGHAVGSHTMTHRRLSDLSADDAVRELEGSRRTLEEKLGRRVEDLSFPYGRRADYRADLKDLARRAGYRSCFNMIRGANAPGGDAGFIHRDALDACWPLVQVKFFMLRG